MFNKLVEDYFNQLQGVKKFQFISGAPANRVFIRAFSSDTGCSDQVWLLSRRTLVPHIVLILV